MKNVECSKKKYYNASKEVVHGEENHAKVSKTTRQRLAG